MIDDDDSAAVAATVDDSVRGPKDLGAAGSVTAEATATTAAEGTAPAPTDDGRLKPGDRIGRYEIVKMLGQGGMGMVYLAYDPTLDRPVALKLLRPELRSAQARLLREGQSVARLAHPNVVRVFDVGADRDDLFIAMEYVDGETLRHWLRAERRSPRAIFEMFAAAGRGLAAAHAAGLVHRDFKPDNVLVGRDGRVVVTDFGLARWGGDEPAPPGAAARLQSLTMTLTRTGSLLGTPAYMSPEQLRGEVADARSDQFGFCVACWEALFGARPFALPERATLDDVRAVVERGVITPANATGAMAPTERALRRGLSVSPADRFPDMESLLAALAPARTRDAPVALAADERIAHFKIRAQLGQGGMGIVYRALDETLGREVALKVLPADVVARADRRERFLREARAAAAVVHPAIATVYEVGADGDVPFIAMEYVAGRTLRETLSSRWEVVPLIKIAIPIADALARAHKAGVVHRDLKPENVMLDGDGAPKILDFGVARIFDVTSPASASAEVSPAVVTSEGVVLGTPAYMSPEQARGLPVDGRSDLFSLGTMLFELLVGAPPFRGASAIDVATAIIRDHPPAPSSRAPGVPAELDRIVGKCLEKDPADRYQDAAELVVDLRRLMRQTETGATAATDIGPPAPRRRWPIAAIGVIAAAAIAGGAYAIARRPDRNADLPPDRPSPAVADRALTSASNRTFQVGELSPDGRMLALASEGRLTLREVDSGAARELSPPAETPNWLTWFPDGKSLLVAIPSGPTTLDLVVTPLDGGTTRTLPVHPYRADVSPDETHLAMYDDTGIRVATLDGSDARLLVGARAQTTLGRPVWSPDGRWIAYSVQGPDTRPSIRAVAADGTTDVMLVDDPELAPIAGVPSYAWLGDDRLVYATYPPSASRLVALRIDLARGRARGPAIELGRYADLAYVQNASADGRRLLYGRSSLIVTTYQAPLAAGASIDLRPNEHQSWRPLGAAFDGRTRVVFSREGERRELLALGADGRPHVLAATDDPIWDATLTPDRTAVLYVELDAASHALSLRRVPVAGGEPAIVEALPYQPSAPPQYTEQLVLQLRCAERAGGGCVLGAAEHGDQVFYAVDPAHGRGRRIAVLHGEPAWSWDLSSGGERLIVAHGQDAIVSVAIADGATRPVLASPGMQVNAVAWTGNGEEIVIAGDLQAGDEIRAIGPDGAAKTVWRSADEGIDEMRAGGGALWVRTSAWARSYWLRETP